MKLLVTVGMGLALVAASSAARADNPKAFGEKGMLAIGADRFMPLFSFSHASITDTQNGIDLTSSSSGSGISLLWGRDFANSGVVNRGILTNPHTLPRVGIDYA